MTTTTGAGNTAPFRPAYHDIAQDHQFVYRPDTGETICTGCSMETIEYLDPNGNIAASIILDWDHHKAKYFTLHAGTLTQVDVESFHAKTGSLEQAQKGLTPPANGEPPLPNVLNRVYSTISGALWVADRFVMGDFARLEERIYYAAHQLEAKANWRIRRLPRRARTALSRAFAAARSAFHHTGIAADRAICFVYFRSTQPVLDFAKPRTVALIPPGSTDHTG